ncbi:hypothetical protein [Marinobacter salarius]|uniref:hypothetical protein n=1 Tax=Marinobacter salarius TaxID=1420917 RepID=UPI003BAA4A93
MPVCDEHRITYDPNYDQCPRCRDEEKPESAIKSPTDEQLKDPAWWDANAPKDAEAAYRHNFGVQFLKMRRGVSFFAPNGDWCHFLNDSEGFMRWNVAIPRPPESSACGTCGESPCGHYYECPPGMPKAQGAKPYINTGLPRVGANSENSGLVISCVTPQVKSWEVLATRKGEAVVYAPACEENGTDQAEVYLMSAAEFKDPIAEREKEDLEADAHKVAMDAAGHEAALIPVRHIVRALNDAGMLRKGARHER